MIISAKTWKTSFRLLLTSLKISITVRFPFFTFLSASSASWSILPNISSWLATIVLTFWNIPPI